MTDSDSDLVLKLNLGFFKLTSTATFDSGPAWNFADETSGP